MSNQKNNTSGKGFSNSRSAIPPRGRQKNELAKVKERLEDGGSSSERP